MFFNILKFIFICLEVLAIFNLLIIVHELGHFLAARWRGLYVEGFGIWFGKPLWKKKINGVNYSFGSIPFGGFVKLPQMAPMESLEGETEIPPGELKPVSPLDKIIVAFAGPLFSFLLAVAFAVIVWGIGRPVSDSEATTVIGYVLPGSPAEKIGLQPGDKILEIDGKPVNRFSGMSDDSVTWRIVRSEGDTISIKVERDGAIREFAPVPSVPETRFWQRKGFRQIGIQPAETPMVAQVEKGGPADRAGIQSKDLIIGVNGKKIFDAMAIYENGVPQPDKPLMLTIQRGTETLTREFSPLGAVVQAVTKNSPAEQAGIRKGDLVTGINGIPMPNSIALSEYVHMHSGTEITLAVVRDKANQQIRVRPRVPEGAERPFIGVEWSNEDGWKFASMTRIIHPGPVEQIYSSVMSIVNTVEAVTARKSGLGVQHLGGPVMMMRIYYFMFESPDGWRMALWFSVVLNVNLALLNLVPIPVLDGGHITFALIEAATRKPVNHKVLEAVNTAAALLVIGFMLFVTFFDVQDLFGGKSPSLKFKPKPAMEKGK